MIEDIRSKIDVLVDMAGSTTNINTLKAELDEVEKEIQHKKKELNLLNNGSNDKYFKASEKQVDENIKVSLELKIKRHEKLLKELQDEIDENTLEEEKLHNDICALEEEIASCNSYIATLTSRLDMLEDKNIKKNYEEIITNENNKMNDLNGNLEELKKNYDEILEKLNYLNLAKEERINKIESDKRNLEDTKSNLINPSSYIDLDLKAIDDDRIEELKEELHTLEQRKLELITDPALIADDAKALIRDEDRMSAFSKIRELVTLVKSKPFMDIENTGNIEDILNQTLEDTIEQRDQFAMEIDRKDYTGVSNRALEERIAFLNSLKSINEEEKIKIEAQITELDKNEFNILSTKINETTDMLDKISASIIEYGKIINDNLEEKTPKRRAVLTGAYNHKLTEKALLKTIIEGYKKDQKILIDRITDLENSITNLNARIKDIDIEIKKLKNSEVSSNETKDVLEVENDKKKLKELDENVKAIKHRKKYKQTPDEIFDEIEIYLGSMGNEDDSLIEKNMNLNYEYPPLNDIKEEIEMPALEDVEIELPKEEDVNDFIESSINLDDLIIDRKTEEDTEDANKIDEEISMEPIKEERHKVINVEEIKEPAENTDNNEENPFIIGDYKDDDYLDIKNLFENNGVL